MAFKIASGNAQAKVRRPLLKQFGNFADECLTDDEYRAFLKDRVAKIERQLALMKDREDPTRKSLVAQKIRLSDELFQLNGARKRKGPSALANKFMDVARRNLSKEQFDFFLTIANKELEHES